jgi:uncharacterized protein (DUF1778 family)
MFRVRKDNRREAFVTVRLTRQERERLNEVARQAGYSLSDFTRRAWAMYAERVRSKGKSAEVNEQ